MEKVIMTNLDPEQLETMVFLAVIKALRMQGLSVVKTEKQKRSKLLKPASGKSSILNLIPEDLRAQLIEETKAFIICDYTSELDNRSVDERIKEWAGKAKIPE